MSEHLPGASSRETPKLKDSVPSVELGKLVIQAAGEIVDAGLVDDPDPGRREALNQGQGQLAEAQGEVAGAQPVGRHPNYGKKRSPETRAKMSEAQRGKKRSPETRAKMSEAKRGENNPMYGRSHFDETRAKMSEAQRGENNPMYGRSHSDETRAKISEAKRGKKRSPETRAKMSEAQRGENNPMYGRSHSDETRAKISEAMRGEKHYRYDQNIDKVRLAIADYVQGASMAKASRSAQGFTNTWLVDWRRRHPERFQTFYSEAVAAASLSITQRDIVAHALEIVAESNKDKKLSTKSESS